MSTITQTVAAGFDSVENPVDHRANRFAEHCAATFADRRQLHGRPITQTCFIQFSHQKTVRQKDHIGVSGLTLIISQLTISEAEFLLAVSVKSFRACPTTAIGFHDAFGVPKNSIRHQYLTRFRIVLILPQDHDANLVVDIRHQRSTSCCTTQILFDFGRFV